MPRIVYMFRGGRAELLKRIASGVAPKEFLYGYDSFVEAGWDTSFAEAAPGDSRWARPLMRPWQNMVSKYLATSFAASNVAVHWDKIQKADVILSTTDGNTFPLLVLKQMGLLHARVIAITQGIYDSRRKLEGKFLGRRRIETLGGLMQNISRLVVLGIGDEDAVRSHFGEFGLPPMEIVQFGADEKFWHPADVPSNDTILSVGSDHLRDFPTLLKAAADLPLRLVTRLKLPRELVGPRVTVDGDIDDLALRRLYHESRFVVVPIKNERRDSGHSVTAQAMACGKAVIVSDTPGLWDREFMRDGETCRLVPPENPEALRKVIQELWNDPAQAERIGRNARRLIEERWTSGHFGRHLVRLANSLL
jgi:glycosyltransferase involved in cell wall biosynthesis